MNYTLELGEESLNRALYLMVYDIKKTATENSIVEQTLYTKRLDKIYSDPKQAEEYHKDTQRLVSGLRKIWTNWDHDTSAYVELGLTGAGFLLVLTGVGAPLGAVLIGAGTAVGIADAIKYYEENDPYMGTMMLALQLIPGGELIGILAKSSPKFTKPVLKRFADIVDKLSKNKVLTDVEGKIFEWVSKLFNKHLPDVTKLIKKHSFRALKLKLEREKSSIILRTIINILHFSLQQAPTFIAKLIIKIGRISVTIDQLWTLMATPDSWRSKMRNKSEFSQIIDKLYDGTLSKDIIDGLWTLWQKILGNDEDINNEMLDQLFKYLENYDKEIPLDGNLDKPIEEILPNRWDKSSNNLKNVGDSNPVTFDNIVRGLQNIRKGQKGDIVRELQGILVYLGYDLGESGKNKNGVDGSFGETTETALKEFQRNNKIKETGILDKNTAIKLKQEYDEL
jgi:hypothetical protein